jgi:formylmethanofuran dehydrogenase subunit C
MTRFVVKEAPPVRVSVGALIPERITGFSVSEIERLPLAVGNRSDRVGDWFRIETGDPETVEFAGTCARLDRIGGGMSRGRIVVEGDAGAYLGLGMSGGTITVNGSAGYGVATDLRGGTIRIGGDAGDDLGGSLPGVATGMRDGIVVVKGNAGNHAGRRLRRGLVYIGGNVGTGCGTGMLAGSIVVGGAAGAYAGAAMRRGSIVVLGGAPHIIPTFADCGVHDLVFLRLLGRSLAAFGLGEMAARLSPLRRWAGDAAVGGAGEVFAPA